MAKFETKLSKEIYHQNYQFGEDDDIEDSRWRVSKTLAKVEPDRQDYWAQKFKESMEGFKFCTAGRILANIGTGLKGSSAINCFVDYIGTDSKYDNDSMEGIMDALRRQAFILKSEGGYGVNADVLRPRGAYIEGIGALSPGAVRMLDMWDTQSETITRGAGIKSDRDDVKDKIRKGAQLVSLNIKNPDIEEFITAKQEEGRLTKFNMSILVSNEFMEAVKNGDSWDLKFPDYEKVKELYKEEWDGDYRKWEDKGYPMKTYKTFDDANELWDKIMKCTYNRAEPGILFVDRINNQNNLKDFETILSSNPCGKLLASS